MSFLNWGESPLVLEASQKNARETHLVLGLTEALVAELAQELVEIYSCAATTSSSELRLVLPQNWVLFWKTRSEGSRLLLAHPLKNEWVGTLALSQDGGMRWLEMAKTLRSGQTRALSQVCGLHPVSNFDLVIRLMESV
jgi:hypothetical protein